MMSKSEPLDVAVVGAGVAGLGAAVALCKAGHKVTLFEKSTFNKEIGAAITLTPNGNRVLDAWGFDADAAKQTVKLSFRSIDLETLDLTTSLDFSEVPRRYDNHQFNAFHRVHLHEGLRHVAEQAGAEFELGCKVVDLECEGGVITVGDGHTIRKDLVVLADGINTQFIPHVTGHEMPIQRIGKSIFRTLIPMSRIRADEELWRQLWAGQPSGFLSGRAGGTMFVMYPCANDEIMNCAMFHETPAHLVNNQDWNSPAPLSDVLDVMEHLHPCWTRLAKMADEWRSYTIGFRDPLPSVIHGKAVMIGDCAHAMQPSHAQGGNMGLEDAAALGQLFSNWTAQDKVESRLRLFEQLRLPRNNTTQVLSNAMFYTVFKRGIVNDPYQIIRRFYQGDVLDLHCGYWTEPMRDFFFPYDVFRESAKALRYKDSDEGIPEGVIRHFGRYDA